MLVLVSAALVLKVISVQPALRARVGSTPLRDAIARLAPVLPLDPVVESRDAPKSPARKRRKVLGAVLGGAAGFFAGAAAGNAIDRQIGCRCDDPGLTGTMIGAPVGAIGGAVLGAWLASR